MKAVEGQNRVAEQLGVALRSGRLPHAFLFLGSAGTGRAAMARELARTLLCAEPPRPDEYCGECQDCRLMAAGAHPDYAEAGVPEGRHALPIRVVRELQVAAGLKPVRGARRVFVLHDVDRVTIEAANAFLKTLEEPPGGCVLVLVASSLRQVPETIVSRCRVVRFANLRPEALAQRLEDDGLSPDDAHWLAGRCWGAPGLAEGLARDGLHELNGELIARLGRGHPHDDLALSEWLSARAAGGGPARVALQEMLEGLAVYYRDQALLAAGAEELVLNRAALDQMRAGVAGAPPEEFLERADMVVETIEMIGGNAQMRLALDRMFARLCRPIPPRD